MATPRRPPITTDIQGPEQGASVVSSPTGTFSAPERPDGLMRLANALGNFAPALQQYASALGQQEDRDSRVRGQDAAAEIVQQLRDSGTSLREAVRRGEIAEWENPWFRFGLQEQASRIMADDYGAALQSRSLELLNAGATDVEAFDQAAAELRDQFRSERLGEGAPHVLGASFDSQAQAAEAGLKRSFIQQAGANMVNQLIEGVGIRAKTLLQSGDLSREEIINELELETDRAWSTGVDPVRLHNALSDAVIDEAIRTQDSSLLNLLGEIRTNKRTGARLISLRDIGQKVQQAQLAIDRAEDADRDRAFGARQDEIRDLYSEMAISVGQKIDTAIQAGLDPRKVDISDEVGLLRQAGAMAEAEDLKKFVEMAGDDPSLENPELTRSMHSAIWDSDREPPVSIGDLVSLHVNEDISRGEYDWLQNQLNYRNGAWGLTGGDSAGADALRDPVYTQLMTGFNSQFNNQMGALGAKGADVAKGVRSKVIGYWAEWWAVYGQHLSGPNAQGEKSAALASFIDQAIQATPGARGYLETVMTEQGGEDLSDFISGGRASAQDARDYWARRLLPNNLLQELRVVVSDPNAPISPALAAAFAEAGVARTDESFRLFLEVQEQLQEQNR